MFRRLTLQSAAALALIGALGACSTPSPTAKTVGAIAAQTQHLSTFTQLVAEAGLTATLNGTGPYTVFAPSDAAFQALPAKTRDALKADKEQLKAVLSHHIVPGKVFAADAKVGKLKTLQGSDVAVARAGSFVTVEDALVEEADLKASNGVVHVIDRVLVPPRKK